MAIAGGWNGSRIRLDFLRRTARSPANCCRPQRGPNDFGADGIIEISIIDATAPVAYVDAYARLKVRTRATEARPRVMDPPGAFRRRAGVLIGLAREPEKIGLQTPRIALVAAPKSFRSLDGATYEANGFDIATRMMSMQRAHRAIPGTGGLNLGVATQVKSSIPNRLSRPANTTGEVRVANPSGLVSVGAVVRQIGSDWTADSAVLFRTARRLMQGEVAVPRGSDRNVLTAHLASDQACQSNTVAGAVVGLAGWPSSGWRTCFS